MNADERLLTPAEAAERLNLSPVTIGHMLRAGTLPGQKVGHLWRVRAADLDAYIVAGSEAAAAKRAARAATSPAAAYALAEHVAERARQDIELGMHTAQVAALVAGAEQRHDQQEAIIDRLAQRIDRAEAAADTDPEREPSEAERVAWASAGVPDEDNPYTPEYREWLAAQDTAPAADPDDEGGTP